MTLAKMISRQLSPTYAHRVLLRPRSRLANDKGTTYFLHLPTDDVRGYKSEFDNKYEAC
jgi:hypothetical protein